MWPSWEFGRSLSFCLSIRKGHILSTSVYFNVMDTMNLVINHCARDCLYSISILFPVIGTWFYLEVVMCPAKMLYLSPSHSTMDCWWKYEKLLMGILECSLEDCPFSISSLPRIHTWPHSWHILENHTLQMWKQRWNEPLSLMLA